MLKILGRVFALSTIFLSFVIPVFAENASTSGRPIPNRIERKETQAANRETSLKTRADAEITRRITSLQESITKIHGLKRLSTDQKTAFVSELQTEIAALTDLKTKIDADTDTTTLKTDVQSIVKSYRVYALFLPKIRILIASDTLSDTTEKLTDLANKLQIRINEAKTAGKEVTTLETALSDMQNKIADAKTQATSAQSTVLPLIPEGYPGNQTELQKARQMLETGRKDISTALRDAKSIHQSLKNLRIKPTTNSATNSAE